MIHLDHLFSTHLPHRTTVTPLSTAELTSGWLKYPEERKVLVHGCPGPRWPIFGWKSLSPNPLPCLRHRLDRTLPTRAVGALLWRCLKLCDQRSRAIYMTCVKQQGSKHQKRLVILLFLLFFFNINKQTLSTFHIRVHRNYSISKLLTKFGMSLKLSAFKIDVLFHPTSMRLFPQRCIKPIAPKYLLHRKIDSIQPETFLQTTHRMGEQKQEAHKEPTSNTSN